MQGQEYCKAFTTSYYNPQLFHPKQLHQASHLMPKHHQEVKALSRGIHSCFSVKPTAYDTFYISLLRNMYQSPSMSLCPLSWLRDSAVVPLSSVLRPLARGCTLRGLRGCPALLRGGRALSVGGCCCLSAAAARGVVLAGGGCCCSSCRLRTLAARGFHHRKNFFIYTCFGVYGSMM